MSKAVVFMADGMEMCECLITVDILKRAGIEVVTASVMGKNEVTASHQVKIKAETTVDEVDFADADVIILPGGRVGTENLAANETVIAKCREFAAKNGCDPQERKWVAAICAAPSVLSGLGLLDGKHATCHPDFAGIVLKGSNFNAYAEIGTNTPDTRDSEMHTADDLVVLKDKSYVVDDNIVTGRALGATFDFALTLVKILEGEEKADQIRRSICLV